MTDHSILTEAQTILDSNPDQSASRAAVVFLAGVVNEMAKDLAAVLARIAEIEARGVLTPDPAAAAPSQDSAKATVRWKLIHDGFGEWYCIPTDKEALFRELKAVGRKDHLALFSERFGEYRIGCVLEKLTFEKPQW